MAVLGGGFKTWEKGEVKVVGDRGHDGGLNLQGMREGQRLIGNLCVTLWTDPHGKVLCFHKQSESQDDI